MIAKIIDGKTTSGNRNLLAKVLPLKTPYIIQVFPTYACNLSCNYCIHSVPVKERGFISREINMEFYLYKKAIDEISLFEDKLKMLRFAGTGEPLLHKDIANMVSYAKEKNVAKSIEIVTNGVLLSEKMSLNLIDAGVDKIRISIQGLSGSAYNKDETFFKNFIENLKFLYQNKKNTNIYIKIIDCALDNNEKKFFEIFGDICDFIAIEHMIPAVKQINYDKIGQGIRNITQNGLMIQDVQVCPQPFYFMQINPDGNIIPCCSMETPVILGNLKNDKLKDIWLGDKFKIFRKIQLLKEKNKFPVCKNCQQYKYMMFPEDNIDNDANGIMERMN